MLDKKVLSELREKLEQTKAELEPEIKKLEKPVDLGDDVDAFDEETDEAEEFSANAGMAQALKERYQLVKDALARIAAGTYGVCGKCSKPIELELLKVDPESRFCKACKKAKQ